MKFLLKIFLTACAVIVLAHFLPGIDIKDGFTYAIIVAAVIGILNAVVRPFLIFFTLPATIFTMGLFIWVINAVIILLADWLLDGFGVANFWWALLFSILLSVLNGLVSKVLKEDNRSLNYDNDSGEKVILRDKNGNKLN